MQNFAEFLRKTQRNSGGKLLGIPEKILQGIPEKIRVLNLTEHEKNINMSTNVNMNKNKNKKIS
jgi:hypothetical protein